MDRARNIKYNTVYNIFIPPKTNYCENQALIYKWNSGMQIISRFISGLVHFMSAVQC